jgi:F-box and leucine-rich repeat protein GRR1
VLGAETFSSYLPFLSEPLHRTNLVIMRSQRGRVAPLSTNEPYRPSPDPERDSQSSSSNSPTRADYEESDFYTGNNDSESSIGVPTFQDMAVSDQTKQPATKRLPAEVLIAIFNKINSPQDVLNCMLVCKRWAWNAVDQLWHRPGCSSWPKHEAICKTLCKTDPYFQYRDFIKRLNLAQLANGVNDGTVLPLSVCKRVERLTLTNCAGLTDSGLIGLVDGSKYLLALDISGAAQITEASMLALASNCHRLQGLNISAYTRISNESLIQVAESCRFIKRVCHDSFLFESLLIAHSSS